MYEATYFLERVPPCSPHSWHRQSPSGAPKGQGAPMSLPISRPEQQRRRLLLLLVLSFILCVCSSCLCFTPRRLHTRRAPHGGGTAEPRCVARAGAGASTAISRPPSFLTAHHRCLSLMSSTSSRPVSSVSAGGPQAGGGGDGPQPSISPRVQAVLDQLQQLTLLEVSQLVRQLEMVFGVSAASALGPGAAATPAEAPAGCQSAGVSGGSDSPDTPEKTEFRVVVKAVPTASRISVIKTLRSVRGDLGLKEAKNFIDSLPKDVTENVSKVEAQKIFDALKAAGAEVEMV